MTAGGTTQPTIIAVPGGGLAFERIANGGGPAVLFIQGVGVAGCAWRPQLAAFGSRYDCIAYDNRGVGGSTAPPGGISIASMADDAVAILDAMGMERVHVVGHSMGGAIALQVALANRSRVLSLALLCTFSRGKEALTPSWPMLRYALPSQLGTRRSRARAMAHLVCPRSVLDERGVDVVVDELSAAFGRPLACRPAVSRAQLQALARFDPRPRLGELSGLRTLVVSGADDPIAPPRFGRRLAQLIGADRYVEMDNASHALTILDAARLNVELERHLSGESTQPRPDLRPPVHA